MNSRNISEQPLPSRRSLAQRVVRGGIWVVALRMVYWGLTVVRTITLARILAPGDFGIFGIVLLAISTLQSFSETGISAALVHKKGKIESYLNTGWTIQIIRGVTLAGLLFICAPFIASFFHEPGASLVLQVLAISVFFDGLQNIGILYFGKELRFDRLFIYRLGGAIADLGIAIPAALLLRTVWALALGLLARSVVSCILSYIVHFYRPSLELNLSKVKELYSFGRWVFANRILNFLHLQGDDIFVGKLLGVIPLGLYQMAYRLPNMPSTEITLAVSRIMFPAYSKLQDNIQELRKAFLKTLRLLAFVTIPLAGGMFVLSPVFVEIILGEKWMPAVPAMRVLCIYGAGRAILGIFGSLFYGVGKPHVLTKIRLIQLATLAPLIYPLALRWGIPGVAIAVATCMALVLVMAIWEAGRILEVRRFDFGKEIFVPAVSSFAIFLSLSMIRRAIALSISVPGFLAMVFLGIVVHLICIYLFDRFSDYGIRGNILAVLRSI